MSNANKTIFSDDMRCECMAKDVRLHAMLISDTHQDVLHPDPTIPQTFLRDAITDGEEAKTPVDAVVIAGDLTSDGDDDNWELFRACWRGRKPAKKVFMAIGNHDTRSRSGEKIPARARYRSARRDIAGTESEKDYFSDVINGYHLIALAGNDKEHLPGEGVRLSQEQIDWFEKELKSGAESGKPVFVVCHECINGTHGLPATWEDVLTPEGHPYKGGLGDQSDLIRDMMTAYKNVFYITGHVHMGWAGEKAKAEHGFSSVEKIGPLNLINLPSLSCGNFHGEGSIIDIGAMMEVYDERVLIRPRDFKTHRYYSGFDMQEGKPYFEISLV